MTTESENIEQITKEPEAIKEKKQKDPKKVEAGKRLAAYHKKAKEAMKNKSDDTISEYKTWMPELSLTTVLSVVGISLTAIDLYFRWRKQNKIEMEAPPTIEKTYEVKPSKIPILKIGME